MDLHMREEGAGRKRRRRKEGGGPGRPQWEACPLTRGGGWGFVAPGRTAVGGTVNYRSPSKLGSAIADLEQGLWFCRSRTLPKTRLFWKVPKEDLT